MARKTVRVWDLPVRLFHWGLVIAVTGAFLAVEAGDMETHKLMGYAAATLVVWRVIWGFAGSSTARFSDFVRGPGAIRAYLAEGRTGTLGHTPLGGLSVLALLGLVLAQAGTGLFSNDDIFFDGPWAGVVGKALSDEITGIHATIKTALIALILLHVLAITWHAAQGRNLLPPMISGVRRVEEDEALPEPEFRGPAAALVALAVAAAITGVAFRFWLL